MEISKKNDEYRERLAACQEQMMDMTQTKSEMKEQIIALQHDRETLKNESKWLGEEVVALRKDMIDLRSRRSLETTTTSTPNSSRSSKQETTQRSEKEQAHILHELRQVRAALCSVTGDPYRSESDQFKSADRGSSLRDMKKEIAMLRLQMSRFRRAQRQGNNTKDTDMPNWLNLEVGSDSWSNQGDDQRKQEELRKHAPSMRNTSTDKSSKERKHQQKQQKQLPSARLPSSARRHKVPVHILTESRDESISTLGNRSFENRVEAEARQLALIQKKRAQGGSTPKSQNGLSLNDFFEQKTYHEEQVTRKDSSPFGEIERDGVTKWKEFPNIHNNRDQPSPSPPPPPPSSPPKNADYQMQEGRNAASAFFDANEGPKTYNGRDQPPPSPRNHSDYHMHEGRNAASAFFDANEGPKTYNGRDQPPPSPRNNTDYQMQEGRNAASPYNGNQEEESASSSPYFAVVEGPKRYVHTNQGPERWKELSRINDEQYEPILVGSQFEL